MLSLKRVRLIRNALEFPRLNHQFDSNLDELQLLDPINPLAELLVQYKHHQFFATHNRLVSPIHISLDFASTQILQIAMVDCPSQLGVGIRNLPNSLFGSGRPHTLRELAKGLRDFHPQPLKNHLENNPTNKKVWFQANDHLNNENSFQFQSNIPILESFLNQNWCVLPNVLLPNVFLFP